LQIVPRQFVTRLKAERFFAGGGALARLPASVQTRIAKALLALEHDAFPRGCKELRNRDGWRIRVGDYRVLYFADKKVRQVVIGVIGHRRDVYRK
jgi:mRNA interferase RelE/StbE